MARPAPEVVERLSAWAPPASSRFVTRAQAVHDPRFTMAALVKAVAQGGPSTVFLFQLWDSYITGHEYDPDVTRAFITATLVWSRRSKCTSIHHKINAPQNTIEPMLLQLLSGDLIDNSDLPDLAAAAFELGSRMAIEKLRARMHKVNTELPISFYLFMLRAATEFDPVDMKNAQEICDVMTSFGVPYYAPQIRLMLRGYSRMPRPPMESIEALVNMCVASEQQQTLDVTIVNELLNVLERTCGEDATRALKIVEKIGRAAVYEPLKSILDTPPSLAKQEHPMNMTFVFVDVVSFLPTDLKPPPASHILVFSFGSVRKYCVDAASSPLYAPQITALRTLIQENSDRVRVLPLEVELSIRSEDNECTVETDVFRRLLSLFRTIFKKKEGLDCRIVCLSKDPRLGAELTAMAARHPTVLFEHWDNVRY